MTSEHILALLIEERDRVNAALESLQGPAKRGPGRPPMPVEAVSAELAKKKRHITASGKRRMAEAQKRRWAAYHATH
jgi:hypothetical protein